MVKTAEKSTAHSARAGTRKPQRRAASARALAAERPTPRRVGRVSAGADDDAAALRSRLSEIETRNAQLADRLTWAIDKLTTVIADLKTRGLK